MGSLADCWKECARAPGTNSAWERLLNEHHTLFSRIVARVAHNFGFHATPDIDDAVQEAWVKLAELARKGTMAQLDGASLEAYLKTVAANAAHDYFERRRARRRDAAVTISIDEPAAAEPRGTGVDDVERAVLLSEIRNLTGGSQRDQIVFLLYYRQGWTAREIAGVRQIALTAEGVESLLARMAKTIRDKMHRPRPREEPGEGFSTSGT
jgi:RNA polymerase sigma-70 factor, ECF subfamily